MSHDPSTRVSTADSDIWPQQPVVAGSSQRGEGTRVCGRRFALHGRSAAFAGLSGKCLIAVAPTHMLLTVVVDAAPTTNDHFIIGAPLCLKPGKLLAHGATRARPSDDVLGSKKHSIHYKNTASIIRCAWCTCVFIALSVVSSRRPCLAEGLEKPEYFCA